MRVVDKPWGHEEVWAESRAYVGKVLVINEGASLSRQFHHIKEETFRVLVGRLLLELGDPRAGEVRVLELGPGDVHHCPPGTVHRMTGLTRVEVLEVSTPELDDVVRLEDSYGRA